MEILVAQQLDISYAHIFHMDGIIFLILHFCPGMAADFFFLSEGFMDTFSTASFFLKTQAERETWKQNYYFMTQFHSQSSVQSRNKTSSQYNENYSFQVFQNILKHNVL